MSDERADAAATEVPKKEESVEEPKEELEPADNQKDEEKVVEVAEVETQE